MFVDLLLVAAVTEPVIF